MKKRAKSAKKQATSKHAETSSNKASRKERITASTNMFSMDERKSSATNESSSNQIHQIQTNQTHQRINSQNATMPPVTSAKHNNPKKHFENPARQIRTVRSQKELTETF